MTITFFTSIFLQASAGGIADVLSKMWPMILIVIVFYFFIIRPQSKRQKEQMQFLDNLEKGAEVVTTSGIYGKISKIEEDIITLQVDTKTFIRVTRSAISKELTVPAKDGKASTSLLN